MRNRPNRLAALCMAAAVAVSAWGEETEEAPTPTFEWAVERAVSTSGTVSALRDTLADQLADTGLQGYLQGIGVSASGAVGGNPGDPFFASGDATLSASVELFPQLSVSGSVSAAGADPTTRQLDPSYAPLKGSVGITVTPLADATGRPRDLLEIERTRVQLESAVQSASHTAVSRLLAAVMAERQVGLDEREYAVAEQSLRATRSLYEKEQATEAAYTAAKDALRSRSHGLLLSRLEAEKALEHLALAVSVPADRLSIPPIEQLGLADFVEQASAFVDSADIDLLTERSAEVLMAALDAEEAEIDLSAARAFSPSLSISASGALPEASYSVEAHFGFTISDFDLEARDDARKGLSSASVAHENTRRMTRFDVRQALLELQIALEELAAAKEPLETARLGLAETRYFAEQGEATELEVAQSELAVKLQEHNVAAAETQVASRWFALEFSQY